MEQEKIGKFIQELRKEKNMTQIELGDKLGVTDRAISKWENGRGMPDLSLIRPLCNELGITINELLSGEMISKQEYQEKLEENILKTIDYSDKKINKIKRFFEILLGLVMLFIITFIIMFCIDIKRMNKNEPVLFSTWGLKYAPPIDLKEEEIEIAIIDYLEEKGDNEPKHHDKEKTFSSMKIYLLEEKSNNLYYVYAWVLNEKYFFDNDKVRQDSGSSIPYKFVVEKINDEFVVTSFIIPRDGSLYDNDIKSIFPKSVRKDMENVYIDGTIERLEIDINRQVDLYFHK